MEIRLAAMDDLAAVTALEAVCFPPAEAAQEDSLRARLAAYPNHFWLLEDEGRLVSFVNGLVTDAYDLTDEMFDDASYHSENGGWQMIFGVATHPDYQRRGCAEKLLRYVRGGAGPPAGKKGPCADLQGASAALLRQGGLRGRGHL